LIEPCGHITRLTKQSTKPKSASAKSAYKFASVMILEVLDKIVGKRFLFNIKNVHKMKKKR